MKRKLILVLMLFFFYNLGMFGMIIIHEKVHQQIYESRDIEVSEIQWNRFFKGEVYVIAYGKCPDEACELANDINDVVGYHLSIIYSIAGAMFIISKLFEKEDVWDY